MAGGILKVVANVLHKNNNMLVIKLISLVLQLKYFFINDYTIIVITVIVIVIVIVIII